MRELRDRSFDPWSIRGRSVVDQWSISGEHGCACEWRRRIVSRVAAAPVREEEKTMKRIQPSASSPYGDLS